MAYKQLFDPPIHPFYPLLPSIFPSIHPSVDKEWQTWHRTAPWGTTQVGGRSMYFFLCLSEGQCRGTVQSDSAEGQYRGAVRALLQCITMACKRTSKQLVEHSPSRVSTQSSSPMKRLIRNGWLGKRFVLADRSY